ncbi:MAG TPA: hypothetical protein VFO95_10165 [Gemmatimonadales bacterium]|nr:hypothetical protein [Gemmatimonadales bacterium]
MLIPRIVGFGFLISLTTACGGEPPTGVPREVPPIGRRSTFDRPAEVAGPQIHAIYMIPADGIDLGYDTTGAVEQSVGFFQYWLAVRTGMMLRADTYQGRLDISFFKSNRSAASNAGFGTQLLNRLLFELRSAGFNDPSTKYLIYYDGSNPLTCGNAIQGGAAAAVYLRGSVDGKPCGGGFSLRNGRAADYWEFAMLHEVIHTLGMVDDAAPNHDEGRPWHVYDGADLMHGGGAAWTPTLIDRNNDDYYGLAVPAGVRNLMNDPILVSAPDQVIAPAKSRDTAVALPAFVHHVLPAGSLELPR